MITTFHISWDDIFTLFGLIRRKAFLILLFSFFALTCKKESPVTPSMNPLQLTVESVSCTDVYLRLSLSSIETQRTLALKRNDSTVAMISLSAGDSLFDDEGLLPSKTYTYTLVLNSWSTTAQAITLDTTSHNFTWQTFTFGGDAGSCQLNDVAIINDTLAYAVGAVYLNDSTGQIDPQPYGIAEWNGAAWRLGKIFDNKAHIITPIRGIDILDTSNIWLAAGSIYYWDGHSEQVQLNFSRLILPNPNGTIEKLFGAEWTNLFGVGNAGTIVCYSGNGWQSLQSGTGLSLNDVWGGSNPWIGNDVLLIAASEKYVAGEKKLLALDNHGTLDSIPWPMQDRRINSVWYDEQSHVYTSGGGVFRYNGSGSWIEQPLPLIYTNRIRGNADNDIVAVGDFGIAAHFNGVTWHVYDELQLSNGNYESVAIRGNLVIAVGWNGESGYIAAGKR
ncbi:MAG TPA: hypothetical protein VMM58_07225 [Bacteroidota bacterium]|nr:hypothetical protein [Bacteroidota bacterium]